MSAQKIEKIVVGPLEVNCYLVWDGETGEALCIDPGDEGERIYETARKHSLTISLIVNTHGHFDHIGGNEALKRATGALIAMHGDDLPAMEEALSHGALFGIAVTPSPRPDILLKEGDTLTAGNLTLSVLHTPGHSRGGISLHAPALRTVFTGDTLFAGGIGRTDLRGGSFEQIIASINDKLFSLDGDTAVMAGHGEDSTIDREKRYNPFLT